MLEREETVDIAFVADNPGDWAFHCHIIEHQKTGFLSQRSVTATVSSSLDPADQPMMGRDARV